MRVVGLPVLEEVVAGDVGLVPGGDERRDAEPELVEAAQQGGADRPRLRRHRDPARAGGHLGEGRRARRRAPVLTTPIVLGPMSRNPRRRACSRRAASRSMPSGPDSANPAEITTRPCTRFRPHCSTTSVICSAGTTTTARSISSGMSRIDGWARTLATTSASRVDRVHRAVEARRRGAAGTTAWPRLSDRREAPITATERGARIRATDRASATRARSSHLGHRPPRSARSGTRPRSRRR